MSKDFGRVLVIVPAYNEEANIAAVVADVRHHAPFADIVVINDGSSDGTAGRAIAAGVAVLSLPFNVGIGAAVQTGFQYAHENCYDTAIQFDGDGQHDGAAIATLLEGLENVDVVIGSRYLGAGNYTAPLARRSGMVVLSAIVSTIVGRRFTDTTSGFRALGRRAISLCAKTYPSDYPEVEVLPIMHRAGLKVIEVPVTMNPRQGGTSSITWARAIYYMVKVILAILIELLRKAPTLHGEKT